MVQKRYEGAGMSAAIHIRCTGVGRWDVTLNTKNRSMSLGDVAVTVSGGFRTTYSEDDGSEVLDTLAEAARRLCVKEFGALGREIPIRLPFWDESGP